ncbi:TrmH family RNA methyltransferase [Rhizobium sp. NRK18]|uniref:TrmH family RNA methyltransferase n=1 Tax=Rhizobium sp. NRK18 TaxID=2964667 RepID=UPI0021C2C93B|nr:RNA methyltransferase [Rhizobium sp. NRK18]MCQ2003403.1 RNA methyltransferase [Rhizobium sp. NRK18]
MSAERSVIVIDDPQDQRITYFRDIREKDMTRREGRFIAEGTVVLRMLAEAHRRGNGIVAEAVLVLRNRLAGIQDILERFPEDVPVYVAEQAVIDAIAGFHLHRGILALGRREDAPDLDAELASLPENALVVVACGISNHDNIGAIFRNAAAFGVDAVFLDQTSCDPLYRKALRVSVGSVLSVPYMRGGSDTELVSRLADAGFDVFCLSPSGQRRITDVAPQGRTALVLGTEGEGLSPDILSRFTVVSIAQAPGLDSLNVATAAGIALHEIASAAGRLR